MADYRVKVCKAFPQGWAARLEDERGEQVPVGVFATMPEAVTTGITALRFVTAGIPWREK